MSLLFRSCFLNFFFSENDHWFENSVSKRHELDRDYSSSIIKLNDKDVFVWFSDDHLAVRKSAKIEKSRNNVNTKMNFSRSKTCLSRIDLIVAKIDLHSPAKGYALFWKLTLESTNLCENHQIWYCTAWYFTIWYYALLKLLDIVCSVRYLLYC